MRVLLTSCGLETKVIENTFLNMLDKSVQDVKAMFIPTAANDPDAIEVLPKCLEDLLKVGVKRENIFVYDLYDDLDIDISKNYDVIYLCGGSTKYLLRRILERGFDKKIKDFIENNGLILGVSAGSVIFANNLENNLGLIKSHLNVHVDDSCRMKVDVYDNDSLEEINLGNNQAIVVDNDTLTIIE